MMNLDDAVDMLLFIPDTQNLEKINWVWTL